MQYTTGSINSTSRHPQLPKPVYFYFNGEIRTLIFTCVYLSLVCTNYVAVMAYDGGRDYGGGYDDSYDDRPEFRDGFRDLQPPEPGVDSTNYVPDVVKTFVVYLYRHIREKNVYEIHQMYEGSFQKLSERLFKQSNWPAVDMIAPYVENDHVFCLLYKEMWFRHVYARLQPTLEQRCDSWDNYCNLFQVILHGNVNMQLPNQWLWDMVDEFIYQFQSFCQYRAKLKQKSDHELAVLRQIDEVCSQLTFQLWRFHHLWSVWG